MSKTFDKMQKSLGIVGQEIAVELKIDKRNSSKKEISLKNLNEKKYIE